MTDILTLSLLVMWPVPELNKNTIQYIVSILLDSLLKRLLHIFYELYVQFSFRLQCMALLVLKNFNANFLRHCCLIWKCKQHTFDTFSSDQVYCRVNNKSSLKCSKCLFRFKSFKLKQRENKLSKVMITEQEAFFMVLY